MCMRVCVNVCFCYLLHILLPLFLSFTRIFIYCCLLECRYHLSVYFRHMCRRTQCTQTRTLRRAHQHSQIHSHGVLLLVMHRRRRFMRSAPLSALMPWYPLHTKLEKVLNQHSILTDRRASSLSARKSRKTYLMFSGSTYNCEQGLKRMWYTHVRYYIIFACVFP